LTPHSSEPPPAASLSRPPAHATKRLSCRTSATEHQDALPAAFSATNSCHSASPGGYRVEALSKLHAHGCSLTPSEIDLFIEFGPEPWFWFEHHVAAPDALSRTAGLAETSGERTAPV
jgi:hypothetical protein